MRYDLYEIKKFRENCLYFEEIYFFKVVFEEEQIRATFKNYSWLLLLVINEIISHNFNIVFLTLSYNSNRRNDASSLLPV